MRLSRRHALGALAALPASLLSLTSLTARTAWAQNTFPTRPVRLLVGFAPGGLTDIAARALAERMGKTLKHNVVVENRPGGQAIIATVAVARAEPDGYTLGFAGTNGMILNPLLYNNLPYQPSDFKQLGSMGKSPML
ncbi:MAG TPA: tripartite tricarboxylate transporter substrate-binding protein, partial [Achromobacter sp.]